MMKKQHAIEIGGRVALAGLLFIGLTAFAIELNKKPDAQLAMNLSAPSIVEGPLEAELRWCRHLGDEALQDKACLKAWAQNRESFLKYAPPKPSSEIASPEGYKPVDLPPDMPEGR
jgi:conjugative transfer region protein TrbK